MPESAERRVGHRQPFDLLAVLAGDTAMAEVFSEQGIIVGWLRTEVALARAQAQLGVIPATAADAIEQCASRAEFDLERLWAEARNVGYPILPLVRQIDEQIPVGQRGFLHYGATTQDIMDTGLSLQLVTASDLLLAAVDRLGDALAAAAAEQADTVMAARTHAQQAVPTTWGAQLAGYLGEVTRQRVRLDEVREGVRYLSLFGAGGTSAAYGPTVGSVRELAAALLGLRPDVVSHHVARDCLTAWGLQAASICATTCRLAREVIDLSRNEIAELGERSGHLRGASSTMPQKANPISSEVLVGLAATSGALASALYRAMEAGHERAAGEWQSEWQVLPLLACQAATALATAIDLVENLQVFPEAMRANLNVDHGLVMAEAYMITLASELGRENAHELVYAAARDARAHNLSLFDAVQARARDQGHVVPDRPISPSSYLGEAGRQVQVAVAVWNDRRASQSAVAKAAP